MIEKTIQGEEVPALGLGTWQLTGRQCREGVAHALDLGYRHIDTAQIYDNEDEVGQGLRDSGVDRDEVFLTTKIWRSNVAPADMRRSTEESLRKLSVDRVDLLLIHWPVDRVPLQKQLDALVELQREGRARHVGVSNFLPDQIDSIVGYLPDDGLLFAHQAEYHPFLDQSPLLAQAREHDHLFTAYSPLARGRVMDHETLKEIGARHEKTAAQVTLRWLLQQEKVSAIPKAASADHREANFDIFDFELSTEEMDTISSLRGNQRILNPGFAPDWDY
jgi:2,5-diketo-D-gluconate reductase B